jgi:hypothetical protein
VVRSSRLFSVSRADLNVRTSHRARPRTENCELKQKGRRFTGALPGWGNYGLLAPSGLLEQSIELCTSSPMNFRRTRNKRHVTCHDPPRRRCGPDRPLLLALGWKGGAGAHDLFKERCSRLPHPIRILHETRSHGVYCTRGLPFLFRAWLIGYVFCSKSQTKNCTLAPRPPRGLRRNFVC